MFIPSLTIILSSLLIPYPLISQTTHIISFPLSLPINHFISHHFHFPMSLIKIPKPQESQIFSGCPLSLSLSNFQRENYHLIKPHCPHSPSHTTIYLALKQQSTKFPYSISITTKHWLIAITKSHKLTWSKGGRVNLNFCGAMEKIWLSALCTVTVAQCIAPSLGAVTVQVFTM